MEKSKSIISWGQLFIIFCSMCLFLYAFVTRVNFNPQVSQKIEYLSNYEFSSGAIISYCGNDEEVIIPSSYSLGPTTNIKGRVTFDNLNQAFDFLDENYANGASGYYDFYNELMTHTYPWIYDYSIDKPTYIVGNDIIVKQINERVFSNKSNIKKVVIPNTVESIGNFAFQNCLNLKEVVFSEGLTFIGDSAFWGCGFENIELPNSLKTIYPYAFFSCKKLKEITLPVNIQNVTIGTFNNCSSLTKVTISSKYDIYAWGTTAYQTFSNCTSLTEIYIPESKLNYYTTNSPWNLYKELYKIFN